MEKLLTPTAARNVFSHGNEAHAFFKNGGANYIGTGSMNFANPNAQALTNGAAANGATLLMAGMGYDNAPKAAEMMKNADRELLEGKHIAGAEMVAVSAEQAAKMVEKAEQQTESNNLAIEMAIKKNGITR